MLAIIDRTTIQRLLNMSLFPIESFTRAYATILLSCVLLVASSAIAQDKLAAYTVKIEATGMNCGSGRDTVNQFAVKLADQQGLWTIYSPIAASKSVRIKGERKMGINMVIAKVDLEADLCQLMPMADQTNKAMFDKLYPFAAGLSFAEQSDLPAKVGFVVLAGKNETYQEQYTVPNTTYGTLKQVPRVDSLDALPSFLAQDKINTFITIRDSASAQRVLRRMVGGPVFGEDWKKKGILGIIGGVLPGREQNTYVAWVIQAPVILDRMRYRSLSVIPRAMREELMARACGARMAAMEQRTQRVADPAALDTSGLKVQEPLYDRMVVLLSRFREVRSNKISRSALCGQGNLDIATAYNMSLQEQQDAKNNVGFGTLVPMMACIHEEYCRSKDRTPVRNRPDFRAKAVEFNRRVDFLSPIEMQALAEAGVSVEQVADFAQELFVLSHHENFMSRAASDTAADLRTLCKTRALQEEFIQWKEVSTRVPSYPSAWRNQVDEMEFRVRRLHRVMLDTLEAQLLRQPLEFEALADQVEHNACLNADDASALIERIMLAKQPDPAKKRAVNATHARTMQKSWSQMVKSIEGLERLPNWEFSYVSYDDSLVMKLRFSGGRAVEEVGGAVGRDGKQAPPAARACSYGFPLGSCIYPEAIPAVQLFAAFVNENYFRQDNGFAPSALRIIGSADNTPIKSKLNYPPEILQDLSEAPAAASDNQLLAYARAAYARYVLAQEPYQWPSMMQGSTTVTGVEVAEEGEEHRSIQLVLVVVPKE